MSSSATGVGMTICFLGAILLILTQKSSQKFGDVLGIMSRGAEKKVAKKPSCLYLRCLQRNKGQPPIKKFYRTAIISNIGGYGIPAIPTQPHNRRAWHPYHTHAAYKHKKPV